jgi:hypothetical protein
VSHLGLNSSSKALTQYSGHFLGVGGGRLDKKVAYPVGCSSNKTPNKPPWIFYTTYLQKWVI